MTRRIADKVKRLTISLPENVVVMLEKAAIEGVYKVPVSEVVRVACTEHLKARGFYTD